MQPFATDLEGSLVDSPVGEGSLVVGSQFNGDSDDTSGLVSGNGAASSVSSGVLVGPRSRIYVIVPAESTLMVVLLVLNLMDNGKSVYKRRDKRRIQVQRAFSAE